jgi:hypothetical protein
MKKNTLVIIIFVSVLVLVIGGWIFFFLRQKNGGPDVSPLPEISSPMISGGSPQASVSPSQFEKITENIVLSPAFASRTVVFFDRTEGYFKTAIPVLDIFKENKQSETVFENVFSVSWSPNKKLVLVGFYQNQIVKKYAVFELQQNLTYLLPDYVKEAVWSFDSAKLLISHSLPSRGEFYLALINFDGTKETKVLDLGLSDFKYFLTNQNQIIFYEKPSPQYPTERVFIYDLKTKKISVINLSIRETFKNGFYGFDILPSPDGKILLISLTGDGSGKNLSNFVQNLETNKITELDLKTLVQKCAWSENSEEIFCAYSSELAAAGNLPFDYWMGKIRSRDSFVKLNLRTGEKKVYAEGTDFDALNLAVSSEKDSLLFVNQADQSLYRMRLK